MASKKTSYANEDRRARGCGATVDIPFLVLILLLLLVGLTMLYSASFAQYASISAASSATFWAVIVQYLACFASSSPFSE